MWEREGPVGGGMGVVYWPSHYLEGERERCCECVRKREWERERECVCVCMREI